jgi:diphosphomevalonate decarboxylase
MLDVMRTSTPALNYQTPATLELMRKILGWRAGGLPVAFTVDAGPNVHCLCPQESAEAVESRLREIPAVLEILHGQPGGGTRVIKIG